jgi:hypothetical protein
VGEYKSRLVWLLKHFSPTQGQKRQRVEQVVRKNRQRRAQWAFFIIDLSFFTGCFFLLEFVGPCHPVRRSTTRPTASFWAFFFSFSLPRGPRLRIFAIGSMGPVGCTGRQHCCSDLSPLLPPDHSRLAPKPKTTQRLDQHEHIILTGSYFYPISPSSFLLCSVFPTRE